MLPYIRQMEPINMELNTVDGTDQCGAKHDRWNKEEMSILVLTYTTGFLVSPFLLVVST